MLIIQNKNKLTLLDNNFIGKGLNFWQLIVIQLV